MCILKAEGLEWMKSEDDVWAKCVHSRKYTPNSSQAMVSMWWSIIKWHCMRNVRALMQTSIFSPQELRTQKILHTYACIFQLQLTRSRKKPNLLRCIHVRNGKEKKTLPIVFSYPLHKLLCSPFHKYKLLQNGWSKNLELGSSRKS